MDSPNNKTLSNMAEPIPHALIYYVEESVEAMSLSSAREICLAFDFSQSLNLLKHFKKFSAT